jgi:hypothetical protein
VRQKNERTFLRTWGWFATEQGLCDSLQLRFRLEMRAGLFVEGSERVNDVLVRGASIGGWIVTVGQLRNLVE